jgi:hypothetical protein
MLDLLKIDAYFASIVRHFSVVTLVTYSSNKIILSMADIFACSLDLNFKHSKLARLNF